MVPHITLQNLQEIEIELSIQDLLNARGVGDSTSTNPATTSPDDEQQPDENKPDKDGDGQ